jgi:His-Xaa-Ser system protein HxsD
MIRRTEVVDVQLFSAELTKKAAYKFSHSCSVAFELSGNKLSCLFVFIDSATDQLAEVTLANFRKELVDQDLRQIVRAETTHVRNLILAHTFSRTGLGDDQ